MNARVRTKAKPSLPPLQATGPQVKGSRSSIEAALAFFLMSAPNHALRMLPEFLADFQAQRKDFDFVELVHTDGTVILAMVPSTKNALQTPSGT